MRLSLLGALVLCVFRRKVVYTENEEDGDGDGGDVSLPLIAGRREELLQGLDARFFVPSNVML